jgi:hypothetical protein
MTHAIFDQAQYLLYIFVPTHRMRVHMMTIPAHGHYMTLRDVGVALAAQGYDVSFVMCERNRGNFEADGLPAKQIKFISAGPCTVYNDYDAVMRKLIADPSMENTGAMLDGVSQLSYEMCRHVLPLYEQAASPATPSEDAPFTALPDVLVFDADTFCAMDISARYRIPRVARVGTGPRDMETTPSYVPGYGTALPLHMTLPQRVQNALARILSMHVLSPLVMPRLQARFRMHWVTCGRGPGDASGNADGGVEDCFVPMAEAERRAVLAQKRYCTRPANNQDRDPSPRDLAGDAGMDPLASTARTDSAGMEEAFADACYRHDVPWEGIPILYNTHWGLAHPRPLLPFEHAVGFTTDFEAELERQRWGMHPAMRRWLESDYAAEDDEAEGVGASGPSGAMSPPVVYVGLGTLSVVDSALLQAIAESLVQTVRTTNAHVLWSLPADQQLVLQAFADRLRSEPGSAGAAAGAAPLCIDFLRTRSAASVAHQGGIDPEDQGKPIPPIAAVASPVLHCPVVVADWAPQLAVLTHRRTAAFVTHGGMNGVAEATYAHRPMVCMPLFSDQPDNCRHIDDRGYGLAVSRHEVLMHWRNQKNGTRDLAAAADPISSSLSSILGKGQRRRFQRAIDLAWQRNLAAGGVNRAVAIIESTASLGYDGHKHLLPRMYSLPWLQRHDLDLLVITGISLFIFLACIVRVCRACCRRALLCFRPRSDGSGNGKQKMT